MSHDTPASNDKTPRSVLHRLMAPLRNSGQPLSGRLVLGLLIGAAIGGILALGLGSAYAALAAIVGAYLGAVSLGNTLLFALRLVGFLGSVTIITIIAAQVTSGNAVLQAIALGALAFAGAVWALVPYIGPLGGGFAPMLFVLLSAVFGTSDLGAAGVAPTIAGLCGVVAALLLALVAHARDPLGALRRGVADAWSADATLDSQATTAETSRLSGRPLLLSALLQQAALATLGRTTITPDTPPQAIDQATAADQALADAIRPPGPMVPRHVELTLPDEQSATDTDQPSIGLQRWTDALNTSAQLLAGTAQPHRMPWFGPSITQLAWGSLIHANDVRRRYGLQRAIALGGSWLVLSWLQWPQPLWVLITLLAVVQPASPVTLVKAIQRGAGTLLGAVMGALLTLALPPDILVPWLAGAAILIGLLWIRRNYAVTTALIAAAIVIFSGATTGTAWEIAGVRLLDTVIGVVIGWAITAVVFPVRANLMPRRNRALAAIDQLLTDADSPDRRQLQRDFLIASGALSNYRANQALIRPGGSPSADEARADIDNVEQLMRKVTMLAVLRNEGALDDAAAAPVDERFSKQLADLRAHPFSDAKA